MKTRLEEKLYREYVAFFEKAERERRWSVFEDIPWERIDRSAPDELADAAETFCAVEMYLSDYVGQALDVARPHFGSAWFQANWAYEESKHALALGEYLMRSGKRTREAMFDLHDRVLAKKWTMPFETARQMTFYGCVQEMATFVIYVKHREIASRHGDEALRTIYDFVARDEIAHARFYQGVMKILLEEDRDGTLADMALVLADFEMPGVGLVPGYDRILKTREAGLDRSLFLQKVYIPILKHLGVTRHELLATRAGVMSSKRDRELAVLASSATADA